MNFIIANAVDFDKAIQFHAVIIVITQRVEDRASVMWGRCSGMSFRSYADPPQFDDRTNSRLKEAPWNRFAGGYLEIPRIDQWNIAGQKVGHIPCCDREFVISGGGPQEAINRAESDSFRLRLRSH